MASNNCLNKLPVKIVSFNMKGFYQGCPVVDDIISSDNPHNLISSVNQFIFIVA